MTSQITGVDPALNRLVQGGGFCSSSGFPNRACTTALIKPPGYFLSARVFCTNCQIN